MWIEMAPLACLANAEYLIFVVSGLNDYINWWAAWLFLSFD